MGVNWTQPFPSFRGKTKEGEERGKRERRRIRGGREWGEKKEENHRRAEGQRKEQWLYFNRSKFPLSSFHQHHRNLFIVLQESVLQLTVNLEQNQKSKWDKIIFCTIFPQNYSSSSCSFSVECSADFPSTTHQAAYLHGEALLPLVFVFSLSLWNSHLPRGLPLEHSAVSQSFTENWASSFELKANKFIPCFPSFFLLLQTTRSNPDYFLK